ncbi:kelch domain-containing protein 8A isoform X2 [Dunckerocampus dactyliophorus]|uniref:kelch domain-containing protein 8A isoform X2 n=1 Tax=Dunckerocampus dactyliophorus TaxID=161453 RepID=UPI0024067EEC|nr:kelch domain-containing protein 8A isoform X2 [Dunckerocampus dactyliophorus]
MAVPSAHEFHWQSLARLSSGRVYHTLSEVGGQMYMLGGCDAAGRPCPTVELYSPEGDRWISLPSMPTPRAGAAVAAFGKQILVVGGVGEDQSPLKVVEIYNTEEGRWRKRSPLREALMGVSITVKDGRALAVGGMGADLLPRNILQQYDFRKDVWALLPPMPTPRYDANTNLLDNKLYVAGGRQCKRSVKAFEMYDTDTRSWTTLPMLSSKCSYAGVIWDAAGRLCLLGGLRQGGGHQSSKFTKNVSIFDTHRGAWLKSDETVALKTKRADFAAAVLRDRMVVAGGLADSSRCRGDLIRSSAVCAGHSGGFSSPEEKVGEAGSHDLPPMHGLLHRRQRSPSSSGWSQPGAQLGA